MLKCEKCGKEFKNEHGLKIHTTKAHILGPKAAPQKAAPARVTKGALVCKTCGKEVKSDFAMKVHVGRMHKDKKKAGRPAKARRVGRPAGRAVALRAAAGLDVQALTVDQLITIKQQVDGRLADILRQMRAAKVGV